MQLAFTTSMLLMVALLFGACIDTNAPGEPLVEVDEQVFERDIYPILLRDCATPACHGALERFFRVVGPGRVRLSAKTGPLDAATEAEMVLTLTRARSMLGHGDPERSLLLRKPLALAAGGAAHEGHDDFGRNVYRSQRDPSYAALLRWARGQGKP